jgi:hypothetical protein
MTQQTLDGENISGLRQEYLHRVTEALPAAAREAGDWPIDTDHCFGRVVLDNLFEDEWTAHVDGSPAYQTLSAAELRSAIEIADRLLTEGRPTVTTLNENALRWRGSQRRANRR